MFSYRELNQLTTYVLKKTKKINSKSLCSILLNLFALYSLVKILVYKIIQVNAVNISGKTPLYNACWAGSVPCCLALLQADGGSCVVDQSCLHVAIERGSFFC